MKLKLTRLLSLILVMFAMSQTTLASNYYSKVTAHAVGFGVGEGKVYVKYGSEASENERSYQKDSEDKHTEGSIDGAPTHTYYLYAQANEGSYFAGWYNNSDCSGETVSTSISFSIKFTASSTTESTPTHEQRWAKFTSITPTFTLSQGEYYGPRTVEINCETQGATISYRTNPNSNWQTYSGPISVTATTTIYAKAEKANGGVTYSGQSEATYTILKYDAVFAEEISIPYGSPYTLTTDTSDGVDVKTDGTVTASNSTNTSVATVSGLTITPVAVGTTTVTVTSTEGATYLAGSETITITVTAPEGVTTAPSGEYTETYTIPSSGYGTYCSQYPIDFTRSFTNGETAYTVKEKTETLVRLHLIEQTSIKGGVGFVVKGEPGTTVTFRFTNSDYAPTSNMLFGTTAPTYIEYEAAYGMKDGGFHLNNAGVVPAHRAFIPNGSAGSVKALTLDFEEEDPTGIDSPLGETEEGVSIYNLSGQRINKMQRGINIVNGKKIMVK